MYRKTLLSFYKSYQVLNAPRLSVINNRHAPSSLFSFIPTVKMSGGNSKIVTYGEVLAATNNKTVYIIDVREPKELQETGKIPNSINIPLADVESALKGHNNDQFTLKFGRSKPELESPIIFSCRSGKRAGMALDTALKLGFENSKSYEGSWLDWEKHLKH